MLVMIVFQTKSLPLNCRNQRRITSVGITRTRFRAALQQSSVIETHQPAYENAQNSENDDAPAIQPMLVA